MFRFLLSRLTMIVPTFIGVTIAAFSFIRLLPGDPILLMAGERGVTPERRAELEAVMGFDRPLWEQYLGFLGDLLQGNLGVSIVTKAPVLEEFLGRFPATLELSVIAIVFAVALGLPAGVIAAVRDRKSTRLNSSH